MALMITFGAAGVYAQQNPVKMTFSGNGTQGPFTFRLVKAGANAPQPSTTCSRPTKFYFPNVAGAGLFRFFDGSLLQVNLTDGGDCIDFAANEAHCTLTFQVTGGTGRFQGVSGVLTFTERATPILSDASKPPNPVFFTETGEFTGRFPEEATRDHNGLLSRAAVRLERYCGSARPRQGIWVFRVANRTQG
jgi:hypothetical protein